MQNILLPTSDAPPEQGGVAKYIASTLRARSDVTLDLLTERMGTLGIFIHLLRITRGHTREGRPIDLLPLPAFWTHHVVPVGTACWLLSFLKKISYTVFLHGLDFDLARRNVWKRFLLRQILLRAHQVVTNSHALSKEVVTFSGRNDIRVVHPCVANELLHASESIRKGLAHHTPQELGKMLATVAINMTGAGVSVAKAAVHDAPVRLLTVARLVERKGHAKVLRAMKDLPNVTYTIVGDGPMHAELQKEVVYLGVLDRVTFLTAITDDQLPNIYASHDIFVMPTTQTARDREGFGIVYAEAALFGLPCIATRVSGVDEVVLDEQTGLLIEDTHAALCEALQRLAVSPGLRSRLGSSGRAYVLAHFTEAAFAQKIRAF